MRARNVVRAMLLAGMTVVTAAALCQERVVTTGTFRNLDRIETDFRRGVSTREDVRRLLGEPNGNGGALFPTATHSNEVWAYENIEVKSMSAVQGPQPTMQIYNRWELLLIFFDGNLFDGFLWFTSAAEGTGAAK